MNCEKYKNHLPYASRKIDPNGHSAYQKEQDRLKEEFKKDLFKELDIENNPKRELLFTHAWDYGHSYGYYEIYNFALDFVDLIL